MENQLFGKVVRKYESFTTTNAKAMGIPEPFNCMSYFPVIFKTKHLKLVRQRMMKQLQAESHFEMAFHKLSLMNESHSQFSIMCNYMFHYQRENYEWVLYERRPGDWKGPFTKYQAGLTKDIAPFLDKSKWRPGISGHWTYEKPKQKQDYFRNVLRTGICYSWPELCDSGEEYGQKDINTFQWKFEYFNWAQADPKMALESQRKRQMELAQCPHKLDSYLSQTLQNIVNDEINTN